jgi:hypothetical protein
LNISIKKRLDEEVKKRNTTSEVSADKLDPILVAYRYKDPCISLICAMFAYGNVKQIVKFLDSLDFSLLNKSDDDIKEALKNHYYRFQKSKDVIAIFIALKRLHVDNTLEDIFKKGYDKNKNVVDGINEIIKALHVVYEHSSQGYNFLTGKSIQPEKKDLNKYLTSLQEALTTDSTNPTTHFNLACFYSLIEDKDNAYKYLTEAVKNGYKNLKNIKTEPDLKWLRRQQGFKEFVANGYQLNTTKVSEINIPSKNYIEELREIAKLKDEGIITEQEFKELKAKILANVKKE